MIKSELISRLSDIEWEDFEVKEARTDLPKNIRETVTLRECGVWDGQTPFVETNHRL